MSKSSRYTPMLRQYLEVKAEHQDAILLFRMGDFYELFFDDAEKAAPILEVALTARNRGTENEAPMCGVPHHALEVYLAKLLKAGQKVAICDQVEDPATAKGLVKREVTRVVTPGTVSDPSILEGKENNFLASLVWNGEQGEGPFSTSPPGASLCADGTAPRMRWRISPLCDRGRFWCRPDRYPCWCSSGSSNRVSAALWVARSISCRRAARPTSSSGNWGLQP